MNIEGIVLFKLLETQNLDAYADLKACFFSGAYAPIYRNIHKFYLKEGYLPSFDDLEVFTKDPRNRNSILALKTLEVPDTDIDIAVSALIDHYMQTEILHAINNYVDNITYWDVNEMKENLGSILLEADRKLNTDETIVTMDKMPVFEDKEESDKSRISTGISNYWDSTLGGVYREDLILIGGKRGSGKSAVCANLSVAQYEAGNVVPYYTIEMTARETLQRQLSILSGVSFSRIKRHELDDQDIEKLAEIRYKMFDEARDIFEEFLNHRDPYKFEKELMSTKHLKRDGQIVLIDDSELSVTQIDLSLQKLMAEHGERIEIAIVDYLNQVTLGGNADSMYDWKDQVSVSKQLKNLARKYGIAIISPYQIDNDGVARFAKGILDAADMALLIDSKTVENSILFKGSKSRSTEDDFTFRNEIDWKSLRISPQEVDTYPEGEEDEEESKKSKTPSKFVKAVGVSDL